MPFEFAVALAYLVLTGIVNASAFTAQGLRWRSFGWLAVVAAAQLLLMAPYLLPVLLGYPAGVVHTSFEWVHDLLRLNPTALRETAIGNLPGLVAATLALAMRRHWPLPRIAAVALLAWLSVTLLFLARHYAGGALGGTLGGACRGFVVSVHYYHLNLQLGWAVVLGWVLWQAQREITATTPAWASAARCGLALALLAVPLALGTWHWLGLPGDQASRAQVQREGGISIMDDGA